MQKIKSNKFYIIKSLIANIIIVNLFIIKLITVLLYIYFYTFLNKIFYHKQIKDKSQE